MVKRKMFQKRRAGMNNRGFSLVEVIIAVAVLTILMAPIIQQIIQTLSTSAKAKERQYATENAEYVLNYFQETPLTSLLGFASSGKVGSSVKTIDGVVQKASIDGKLNCAVRLSCCRMVMSCLRRIISSSLSLLLCRAIELLQN